MLQGSSNIFHSCSWTIKLTFVSKSLSIYQLYHPIFLRFNNFHHLNGIKLTLLHKKTSTSCLIDNGSLIVHAESKLVCSDLPMSKKCAWFCFERFDASHNFHHLGYQNPEHHWTSQPQTIVLIKYFKA